jgi:hypothetical protein
MQNLQVIEIKGQRVLTTRQLATAYETEVKVIQNNFQRNKDRYTAGKHYIYMDRDELREVKATYPQFDGELNRTSRANFWTEKGALLHAKSLNTEKAWEVYDYLVDFYFRVKEKTAIVPIADTTEPQKNELSKEHAQTALTISGFDIAPAFRELISLLPIEALDEMEKCFRNKTSIALKLAATSILAEKMKRQLV